MQSSDGKTVISCLLLAALRARGLPVQPFKAGPDFIDPGYHSRIAGITSRNLDAWLMGEDGIIEEVLANIENRISIVEGVMGLFDGSDTQSDEGSTMALARLLDWPVILAVTAKRSGRSLAVALRGFIQEAGPGRIRGVILNGVSGGGHADYLREVIQPLAIPVLGALPFCSELRWEERHLGLQASQERSLPSSKALAFLAEQYLDIDSILELSRTAATEARLSFLTGRAQKSTPDYPGSRASLSELPPSIPDRFSGKTDPGDPSSPLGHDYASTAFGFVGQAVIPQRLRIGIARDEAFHFYYQANLDYLIQAGAELVEFSPLYDSALPADIDAIFLGGGFPEIFATRLAQNSSMRSEIRSAIGQGLKCYAECGGLMLLADELITLDQKVYPMAAVIPGTVRMTESLKHFGYCACSEPKEIPGATFHGHEFHHSLWTGESEHANLWTVRRKRSGAFRREGFSTANVHASYVHLHFRTSSAVVQSFFNMKRSETL
ncbi:MAG: cobyrinate a,c-diamide synthase [Verrucomicrobia bacterium]|nr:cobyrinate a,c-diamide synthase [Verrucomicrobiota bacterium]